LLVGGVEFKGSREVPSGGFDVTEPAISVAPIAVEPSVRWLVAQHLIVVLYGFVKVTGFGVSDATCMLFVKLSRTGTRKWQPANDPDYQQNVTR
jgi:hypothetical protein